MGSSSSDSGLVFAVNVYVSEGRDAALVTRLTDAAGPACVHVFTDHAYNRTGFTLASQDTERLRASILRLASVAVAQLDLRAHTASHPRMGVVDHIAVHPLLHGGAQPTAADVASGAALATATAQALAAAPLWVPVYMYGAASPKGDVALADVRRRLGYFTPSKGGTTSIWGLGDADTDTSSVMQPPPEYGPPVAHPTAGVACVGALPRWVTNFNLVLTWAGEGKGAQHGDQAALLVEARAVAMAVSARRGGPAGCQSMALGRHVGEEAAGSDAQSQNEVEVACNVLAPPAGPSLDKVSALVAAAAQSRGLRVVRQYCTNVEPHQLRDLALARDRTPMPGS